MTFGHDAFGRNAFSASVGLTKPIKRAETRTFEATGQPSEMSAPGSNGIRSFKYYRDHGMQRQGTAYDWVRDTEDSCDASPCLPPAEVPFERYLIGGNIEWGSKGGSQPSMSGLDSNNALLLHDFRSDKGGAVHIKPAPNWKVKLGIISYYKDNHWMKNNWMAKCSGGGWGCFADEGFFGYGRSTETSDGPSGKSWEKFEIVLHGDNVGGSGDYLSIDVDSDVTGIDKFRYKHQGTMRGHNKDIGNSGSRGGRDVGGPPWNGAVAVVFLGAQYVEEGCREPSANNYCESCNTTKNEDCRYDDTTITEFAPSKTKGNPNTVVRLKWDIDSPQNPTSIKIEKVAGGATTETFPMTVTTLGKNSGTNVTLTETGTYKFKITAVGVGDSTASKITSGIDISEPDPTAILGCMDDSATNYDSTATVDDGSCIAPETPENGNGNGNGNGDGNGNGQPYWHKPPVTATTQKSNMPLIIGGSVAALVLVLAMSK